MEDQRNKIKGKIRALLNKTVENGASEQEAILALKKANELMLENFICEHDLEGVAPEKIIEVREPIVVSSYDFSIFYGELARLFDCESFYVSGRNGYVVFFGFETDAKLAVYFYKLIMRAALNAVSEYKESFEFIHSKAFYGLHGRTLIASYVKGFTGRLALRLREMYEQRKSSIPVGMGLMVIEKEKEVEAEFNEKYTGIKTHKVNLDNVQKEAFKAGVAGGDKIDLVQPLDVGITENMPQLAM